MFGTDNIVDNILGQKKEGCPMLGRRGTRGPGLRTGLSNINSGKVNLTNSNHVLMKIKNLMDQIPDVKSVEGDLTIQLSDGDVVKMKLNYKDRGI